MKRRPANNLDWTENMDTLAGWDQAWIAAKNRWGYDRLKVALLPVEFDLGTGCLAVKWEMGQGHVDLYDVRTGYLISSHDYLHELWEFYALHKLGEALTNDIKRLSPTNYIMHIKK